MRRRIIALIILVLMLSGCSTDTIESSLRVPEMPVEFAELNDEISKIKAQGMELVSPTGGTNRQSVQLTDLDGDGVDEGIAVFRQMSNSYKCYAYVFKKNGTDYEITTQIEGAGDSVSSIAYTDMLGNGNNDVIICWSVSDSDARVVTAHTLVDGNIKKLCEVACLYYLTYDVNGDTAGDLCVVCEDISDGVQSLAVYMQEEDGLVLKSTAPLSQNSEKILRIRSGYLNEASPAIFVEKEYNSSGIVTDALVWQDDEIKNITYSAEENMSVQTARELPEYCSDIDGDFALEIPLVDKLEAVTAPEDVEVLQGFVWYGFDSENKLVKKAYTFRKNNDNWYLSLPLDWISKTTVQYHTDDFSHSTTTFYSYGSGESAPLFSIVAISGDNREKHLEQLGFEKISERNNVIYAVDIYKKRYLGYDITAEMITERFYYSSTEWSTGEVVF